MTAILLPRATPKALLPPDPLPLTLNHLIELPEGACPIS